MIKLGIRQGTTIGIFRKKSIAVYLLNMRTIKKLIFQLQAMRMFGC